MLQGLEGMVNIADNILVFGSTQQEHNSNVITFMERCLEVKAIKDWPTPSNVKELQSFLGLINYLSHFVPELSSLRTPLQPLVKTNTDSIWLKESH